MISLSTTLTLNLGWNQTDSDDLSNQSFQGNMTYDKTLGNYAPGSGLDRASKPFSEVGTLSSGSQKIFDLQSLSGIYLSGFQVFGLDKVKILAIRNMSENSGYKLNIGGAIANPFSGHFSSGNSIGYVGPDSVYLMEDKKNGFTVSSTSRYLRLQNPNNSGLQYQIVIIGQSG